MSEQLTLHFMWSPVAIMSKTRSESSVNMSTHNMPTLKAHPICERFCLRPESTRCTSNEDNSLHAPTPPDDVIKVNRSYANDIKWDNNPPADVRK